MAQPSDLEQWLKQMGYTGNIPKNMDSIRNPATEHLWAHLMKNIRPVQEVVDIRRKVIAHRIKTKADQQNGGLYPLQETTMYNKNKELETKLNEIQHSIEEKKRELNSLSQKAKIKSLLIEKQEYNIKEIKDRTYLLNKKKELLEKDVEDSQRYFNSVKNFPPTIFEEVPNTQIISEIIQESANKLEKQFKPSLITFSNSSVNFSRAPTPSLHTTISRTRLFSRESATNPDYSFQLLSESCLHNSNLFLPGSSSPLFSLRHESTPCSSSIRKSLFPLSSTKKTTVCPNMVKLLMEKLYMETSVQDKLKNLLWEHNRQIIWDVFLGLAKNLRDELLKYSLKNIKFPKMVMNADDIMQLEMFHIETELEVMKNNALTENYNLEIIKMKDGIKASLINDEPDKIAQIMNTLELKLGQVAVDVGLQVMKDSILPELIENYSELKLQSANVLQLISKLERDIAKKAANISEYIGAAQGILTSSKDIQDDALNKLQLYPEGSRHSLYPDENIFTEELAIFEKFPLNYNRACTFTNPNVYFRDIYPNTCPTDINLDTNILYMLADILETPFGPPEVVLFSFLKAKKKLETLNSLEMNKVPASEQYSLNDLRCRESYIDFALDQLTNLKRSKTCLEVSIAADSIMKILNMQIPFKDVVAPSRKVDGKEYKYYEEEFETYVRSLSEDQ